MKRLLKFVLILMLMTIGTNKSDARNIVVQSTDTASITQLAKLNTVDLGIDRLIPIPGMGLFINTGDGEFKSLDRERCPGFDKFMLLDNMWYDQLVATGNRFLIRSGCQVYEVDKTKCSLIADFDTSCFRMFAGNDSIFYIVVYNDVGSSIYSCSLTDGNAMPQVTLKDNILRVESMDNGFAFIAGNTLYYADGKELHQLFDTEEPLADMVLTQHGILFCTATSLYMYDGENVKPLARDKFRNLFYDNGRTYIVLADGTVWHSDLF